MLCDDEIEEFLVAFTVEKGKKKRACIKQTLFFDLTQPVRVATNKISRYVVPLQFQSNATRAGCNSKLAQTKQQVVMHFVQCLSVF